MLQNFNNWLYPGASPSGTRADFAFLFLYIFWRGRLFSFFHFLFFLFPQECQTKLLLFSFFFFFLSFFSSYLRLGFTYKYNPRLLSSYSSGVAVLAAGVRAFLPSSQLVLYLC